MRRRLVIRNLEHARQWVDDKVGKPSKAGDPWEAQNIMVGCVQSINQCGRSVQSWVNRKNRRRVLRDIQERYNTKAGGRVLRQLIDFAISELQACAWRDDFWIGALPIKRRQRTISEAGKRNQRAGKAKAKEQREAARKARFAKEAA